MIRGEARDLEGEREASIWKSNSEITRHVTLFPLLSNRRRGRGETLVEFDRYDESSYSAERDTSSKRLSWGNRRGRRSEKGEGKFN